MWIGKKKYEAIKTTLEQHNKSIEGIIDIFQAHGKLIEDQNKKIEKMQKDIQSLQISLRTQTKLK